jgi:hypothetical protein
LSATLEPLEFLDLSYNEELIYAALDLLIKGCPRLQEVTLPGGTLTQPWTPESWARLKAFKNEAARGKTGTSK